MPSKMKYDPTGLVREPGIGKSSLVAEALAEAVQPGWPLFRRRRALVSVGAGTSWELRLRSGVTPGVRLDPPALDRLHQRCHVTLLAGLFERRIQVLVVPPSPVTFPAREPGIARAGPQVTHLVTAIDGRGRPLIIVVLAVTTARTDVRTQDGTIAFGGLDRRENVIVAP
ncbi:MAG TPA: hypothetical protein VG268_11690 [Streptosporangiaceae bacterium]|nr:hypothetical protein [Streptosporangiaceae bacterium]